jgi:hypothetical protein
LLTLGMNARRPAKAVLADARAGGAAAASLTPGDWKLLAFYSWETDERQLVPKEGVPALQRQLAERCPADQQESAARLFLKAVAAADPEEGRKPTWRASAADRARTLSVLDDPARARRYMDVLTNYAASLVRALSAPSTADRLTIVKALDAALARLAADATLSRADRMTAVIARVEIAGLPGGPAGKAPPPALPAALLAEVRDHAARADREITDGYERQAVITTAAYMLGQAGLMPEADALLKTNLAKSHSPYYLMSSLASNAKKRGDKAQALRWYEEAFDKSEGPATRQQWGASYVVALVDLAPQDEARIEKAVRQLFNEAGAQPDAFYERSARSLQRVGSALHGWNRHGTHAAAMQRLQATLDAACRGLDAGDPQRRVCESLLQPPAKKPPA